MYYTMQRKSEDWYQKSLPTRQNLFGGLATKKCFQLQTTYRWQMVYSRMRLALNIAAACNIRRQTIKYADLMHYNPESATDKVMQG